ncbi:MAG: alanine racemase [candidate division WOR-3 bacterium]
MKNRTWAEINIDNLLYNVKTIKKVIGKDVKILAAVKANAYGHDSIEITRVLSPYIEIFGVASIDEAIELRIHRIPNQILILSPTLEKDAPKIVDYNIMPNLVSYSYAKSIDKESKRKNRITEAHIEIDTGMNRTGISYRDAEREIPKILDLKNIYVSGIFSHFAEAEKEDKGFSIEQKRRYDIILNKLKEKGINFKYRHLANSSGIVNIKGSLYNLVRPGIMLYGQYTDERLKEFIKVKQVMFLKSRICQIKNLKKGDTVSYGRNFVAEKNMKIATVLIGYGDGYSRLLSNKSYMFLKGKRVRVVGNVCMDLTMIDISDVENVKVGDEVEIFGENISINELAKLSGLLNYEILTGIGPRVPRIFVKNGNIYYQKNILATNGGNLV